MKIPGALEPTQPVQSGASSLIFLAEHLKSVLPTVPDGEPEVQKKRPKISLKVGKKRNKG